MRIQAHLYSLGYKPKIVGVCRLTNSHERSNDSLTWSVGEPMHRSRKTDRLSDHALVVLNLTCLTERRIELSSSKCAASQIVKVKLNKEEDLF